MQREDLRYVEGCIFKRAPRTKNDITPENTEYIVGYFQGWHTEVYEGETTLCGIVETLKGSIRLVPFNQLTFIQDDKEKIPEWAISRLNIILTDISNIRSSDIDVNAELRNIANDLEEILEYKKY